MSILRRIANTFLRSKAWHDAGAELNAHIEMRIADNVSAGMSPEEARRAALLRFGNPSLMQERMTSIDTAVVLESFVRDLHYAIRQIRKSPAFALTAILTLALSIGANVAVFGVLNAVLLKPLDLPAPHELYVIVHRQHGYDNQSYPDFLDFQRRNGTFSGIAAYRIWPAGLSRGGTAYKCWHEQVSSNYFDVLGVRPAVGRLFHQNDEHGPSSAPYIVLSDAFWRSHFDADPSIVGATVDVDEHPFTVIGVAPTWFRGTDLFIWPDFWMPVIDEQLLGESTIQNRSSHNLWLIGRLKPGVTANQATEDLSTIARELAKEYPAADDGLTARLVKPGLLGDMFGDPARSFLTGDDGARCFGATGRVH